jgi:hypothetical protein
MGDGANGRQAGTGGGGLDDCSVRRQNMNAAAGRAKDATPGSLVGTDPMASNDDHLKLEDEVVVQNPVHRFAAQLVTEAVAGPFAGPALKRLVHSGLRPPRPRHV